MSVHDDIRKLLPLAAADGLTPGEMRRVREHVAECEPCRRASTDFAELGSGLGSLPTPQPRAELVARVRALAAKRLEQRQAWRGESAAVGLLVVAGWIMALASWPALQAAGKWVLAGWSAPCGDYCFTLAAYSILGFLLAGISAFAVGRHAQAMRRTK